jgi:hypothetical protein
VKRQPPRNRFDINGHTNAKQNGYEATRNKSTRNSSRTHFIAVTAGILAGEKINVLNQEWMIIWLSQFIEDLERIVNLVKKI